MSGFRKSGHIYVIISIISTKFILKILCIGGKIHSDLMKLEEFMCQICVCYLNIYLLYMCKSVIIRNQLIDYLTFKLVTGNLETTD